MKRIFSLLLALTLCAGLLSVGAQAGTIKNAGTFINSSSGVINNSSGSGTLELTGGTFTNNGSITVSSVTGTGTVSGTRPVVAGESGGVSIDYGITYSETGDPYWKLRTTNDNDSGLYAVEFYSSADATQVFREESVSVNEAVSPPPPSASDMTFDKYRVYSWSDSGLGSELIDFTLDRPLVVKREAFEFPTAGNATVTVTQETPYTYETDNGVILDYPYTIQGLDTNQIYYFSHTSGATTFWDRVSHGDDGNALFTTRRSASSGTLYAVRSSSQEASYTIEWSKSYPVSNLTASSGSGYAYFRSKGSSQIATLAFADATMKPVQLADGQTVDTLLKTVVAYSFNEGEYTLSASSEINQVTLANSSKVGLAEVSGSTDRLSLTFYNSTDAGTQQSIVVNESTAMVDLTVQDAGTGYSKIEYRAGDVVEFGSAVQPSLFYVMDSASSIATTVFVIGDTSN